MKLRKECPHGKYDAHPLTDEQRIFSKGWGDGTCPGGVFLPDDTLVIDRRGLEWPALEIALRANLYEDEAADATLVVKDWLDALSVRETE